MIQQFPHNYFVKQDLLNNLEDVLEQIRTDYNMFEKLFKWYPGQVNAVIDPFGRDTDFCNAKPFFRSLFPRITVKTCSFEFFSNIISFKDQE